MNKKPLTDQQLIGNYSKIVYESPQDRNSYYQVKILHVDGSFYRAVKRWIPSSTKHKSLSSAKYEQSFYEKVSSLKEAQKRFITIQVWRKTNEESSDKNRKEIIKDE